MARRSLSARIGSRLKRELADLRLVGTGSLRHHLARLAGRSECQVRIAGAGSVAVRPSQPDLASFRRIFAESEYEVPVPAAREAVRARYGDILAAGSTPAIVDAGAYVGAASLWFAKAFPKAHVVAVEPDPASFALLRRNLDLAARTSAIEAAVGATPGHARIVPAGDSWATQVDRSDAGVRVVTMNDAFRTVPGGEPFLAKINIEGFEADVFSDNLEWLDRIAVLFIEPHDWLLPGKHTSGSFQRALGGRDFHLFIAGPHLCYVRL